MKACGGAVLRALSWAMQIKLTTPRCLWCTRGPPCAAPLSALCRFHQLVVVLQQLVSSRSQRPRGGQHHGPPIGQHRGSQRPLGAQARPDNRFGCLDQHPNPTWPPPAHQPPGAGRRSPLKTRPPTPSPLSLGSGVPMGPRYTLPGRAGLFPLLFRACGSPFHWRIAPKICQSNSQPQSSHGGPQLQN